MAKPKQTPAPKTKVESDEKIKTESASKKHVGKRFFAGMETIHSDLFKLDVADVLKNMGIDGQDPDYIKVPHSHFYHTYDSDGRKQVRCVAIAGHCHEMTEEADPDGGPPLVSCGPAVKEVRRKIKGKFVKVYEPLTDDPHVHEVVYMRSNEVAKRQVNPDAANLIAAEHQKTAPVPGIAG